MGGQVGRRRAGLGGAVAPLLSARQGGPWRRCRVPSAVPPQKKSQVEKVFGQIVPIQGALHGGGNAVEMFHGFFLC